jgi:Fe-S cluster assembly protein SufB
MAYTEEELKKELENKEYEYGFYTDIDSETFPVGLNEEVVRRISQKKKEPEWMTQWRLKAYEAWKNMEEPEWANVRYTNPDYQAISYYSAPKKKDQYKSLDEVDPELLKTFDKLGISLEEQKKLAGVIEENAEFESTDRKVAVDAVFDSVSVGTTFKEELKSAGVIFCSISEAIK